MSLSTSTLGVRQWILTMKMREALTRKRKELTNLHKAAIISYENQKEQNQFYISEASHSLVVMLLVVSS